MTSYQVIWNHIIYYEFWNPKLCSRSYHILWE